MIQALCDTSLASVTSLSIGRGVPEPSVYLPSALTCILISGLPRLRRLDLFPSQFSPEAVRYLHNHPLVCPELRTLSLTVVNKSCVEVFWWLMQLASRRANSQLWLHRIDCVIFGAGGDPETTSDLWDIMSLRCKFWEHLRCVVARRCVKLKCSYALSVLMNSPSLCCRTLPGPRRAQRCIRRMRRHLGDTHYQTGSDS